MIILRMLSLLYFMHCEHECTYVLQHSSLYFIIPHITHQVHYDGYAANKTFNRKWAMVDVKNNNKRLLRRDKWLSYDHTNAEFREWWIQRALDMLAHDEIDGIFVDGLCKVERSFLPVKNHGKAYLVTAKELRERLPPGKILIGNTIRANMGKEGNYRYMRHLDGSYLECGHNILTLWENSTTNVKGTQTGTSDYVKCRGSC